MTSETLPLFPLRSTLFPGGWLDLRIFETRYVDLIRECGRRGIGFGVVSIREGRETDPDCRIYDFGCEARIIDFTTLPDGLLGIRIEGARRFRILNRSIAANGLNVATVEWRPTPPIRAVPTEFAVLVTLLARLAEHGDAQLSSADKARFDDADWVAWRIIERLPLPEAERQHALTQDDPLTRLQWIVDRLPRFQAD